MRANITILRKHQTGPCEVNLLQEFQNAIGDINYITDQAKERILDLEQYSFEATWADENLKKI